ncbi:MAG: single-stranded DNA-binding protein [Bacteroidota bacterium]
MNNLSNRIQLIGNLGRDVEFKETTTGKSLARVSIATKEVYKNQAGEKVVDVQWHNLIGWGKIADKMNVFFKKGKNVAVQGKLMHRSYEDKEGATRKISEVVIQDFMLLN